MAMRLTIRRRTLVSFQESKDYLLPHQGKMKSFLLILFIPTFFESKKEFVIRLKKIEERKSNSTSLRGTEYMV